jgi:steroid delta-isomerase
MMRDLLPPPVHRVAFGILFLTAAALTPLRAQGRSADETRIREALADWVKATDAGDRHRANQIWARDLIGYYPGQPDDTYEREIAAESRPRGPSRAKISLSVIEVIVSGDLAVVHDVWRYHWLTPNPTAADSIRGFEVWRKQADGSWKISRWLTAPFPK